MAVLLLIPMPKKNYLIGVDLGGTKIALALAETSGRILTEETLVTQTKARPAAIISQIISSIRNLIKKGGISSKQVLGIGFGAPGQVLPEQGLVVSSPNLPAWHNIQLIKPITRALKCPVYLDNDANCAALGELYFGAGQKYQNFVFVTISTGIGGGIIIKKDLYRGARNIAGEVGHMIIQANGPACGCGSFGCWEAMASGTAIARLAQAKIRALLKAKVRSVREKVAAKKAAAWLLNLAGGKVNLIDARVVCQAARRGDLLALAVIAEISYYLGIGFTNLINIFNPKLIIISGGVTQDWGLFEPLVNKTVKRLAFSESAASVKIVKSPLGKKTGLMGALALVRHRNK